MSKPQNSHAQNPVDACAEAVYRLMFVQFKAEANRLLTNLRFLHPLVTVAIIVLSACGSQPKLSWEYPAERTPLYFQICHMTKGQSAEQCRNVGKPTPQSQGQQLAYTATLTNEEAAAEKVGVQACAKVCGQTTWINPVR